MAVLGVKELKRDFRAARGATNTALRAASYAGARVVRDKARELAPRATGKSKKKITLKREKVRSGPAITKVGASRSGFYLNIVERGAKGHAIVPRTAALNVKNEPSKGKHTNRRPVLAFRSGGALFFRRRVLRHPGVRPHPWLQPALEQSETAVLDVMGAAFDKSMTAAIEKRGLV